MEARPSPKNIDDACALIGDDELGSNQSNPGEHSMANRKQPPVPILRISKGDSLKTIYAKAQRAFTAADLQKYTEVEEGVPAAQVLAELEALDRELDEKQRRKSKNARTR
jgi:hypothetical protein